MNALVTGGGGFVGRRLVELLLERGDSVRFLARGKYPEVEALGAEGIQVDLRDKDALNGVMEGIDTVFHVAAKAGVWGPYDEYYGINVQGTMNVLDAAENNGVKRFVYTSTPSVVSYTSDIENGGQDIPYAQSYAAHYPATKAEAEQMVLTANSEHIATCSLRPHLIFGPRDPHLLPRFVEGALKGRLRIIGEGTNKVDFTYVDNVAWAHIDAALALENHLSPCAGKAYFISNGEPVALWPWFNELLVSLGEPPLKKRLGHKMAKRIFQAVECLYRILPLGEPLVTGFLADAMARSHWYDMGPAQRDFGYHPRVSMEEAMAPTVQDLSERVVKPFRAS
jgi:nucleoside-diphosphate-sugar epimerase